MFICLFVFLVLGMEPKFLHTLDKHSTIEPDPQSSPHLLHSEVVYWIFSIGRFLPKILGWKSQIAEFPQHILNEWTFIVGWGEPILTVSFYLLRLLAVFILCLFYFSLTYSKGTYLWAQCEISIHGCNM